MAEKSSQNIRLHVTWWFYNTNIKKNAILPESVDLDVVQEWWDVEKRVEVPAPAREAREFPLYPSSLPSNKK